MTTENFTFALANQCPSVDCGEWSAFKCSQIANDLPTMLFWLMVVAGLFIVMSTVLYRDDVSPWIRRLAAIFGVCVFYIAVFMLWGLAYG